MLTIAIDKTSNDALDHIHQSLADYPHLAARAIGKAFRPAGYRLSREMKTAIDKGGVATHKWPGINPQARWMTVARKRGRVKNWRAVTRGKRKKWRGKEYWSERAVKTFAASRARQIQTAPFARFKGGLRYKYDKKTLSMDVGFVNPSVPFLKILERHAGGYSTPISAAARRFAFAMGLPISKHKHYFHIPARPLVGPVWEKEKADTLRNIEHQFLKTIDESI